MDIQNHNYVGYKMIHCHFRNLKLPLSEPLKFVQKIVLLHALIVLIEDEISDSAVVLAV